MMSDSVVITFDDGKKLFYKRLQMSDHDPLNPSSYSLTSSYEGAKQVITRRFTFTEQDYLAAK